MNGMDLTCKSLELNKDANILAITGQIATQEIEKILNAGAKAFLEKLFINKGIDLKI